MAGMTNPEAFSRVQIDKALTDSGWTLTDPKQVRFELHGSSGRGDYVLLGKYGPCASSRQRRRTPTRTMPRSRPHILPVASGVKNDKVSNGIALSPTFHAAIDDGVAYLEYRKTKILFGEKKLFLMETPRPRDTWISGIGSGRPRWCSFTPRRKSC